MTVFGSTCTRPLIDRTLICNAILDHFQITMFCGPINRPCTPLTLFLLSYPLEHIEFIRFSDSRAEPCFAPEARPQRFMLPRNFQSRYRQHLSHLKRLLQITCARRSLNQLSRFTIHLVQEFDIRSIQTRKNVLETNIVPLHDHVPQISLAHPPLLRSRPRPKSIIRSSRRRHAFFVSFCALTNQSFFFF